MFSSSPSLFPTPILSAAATRRVISTPSRVRGIANDAERNAAVVVGFPLREGERVIGAGVMGETLLSGLVRAGRRVDQLMVGEKRAERARELEERYGVAVVSNRQAAAKADTVALVVKPQDMGDVLDEIAPDLRAGQLLVSLAAGITTSFIESRVPDGVAVVRRRGRRGQHRAQ